MKMIWQYYNQDLYKYYPNVMRQDGSFYVTQRIILIWKCLKSTDTKVWYVFYMYTEYYIFIEEKRRKKNVIYVFCLLFSFVCLFLISSFSLPFHLFFVTLFLLLYFLLLENITTTYYYFYHSNKTRHGQRRTL